MENENGEKLLSRIGMTKSEFARKMGEKLLDNIVERNPRSTPLCKSIRKGMSEQENQVANCSMKQSECLARDIVYNYIGKEREKGSLVFL